MARNEWHTITVRIAIDVEVGVGFLGEDTVSDVRSAVEDVAGDMLEWLNSSESGSNGERSFNTWWRHAHRGQPHVNGPWFDGADLGDELEVVAIDSVGDDIGLLL